MGKKTLTVLLLPLIAMSMLGSDCGPASENARHLAEASPQRNPVWSPDGTSIAFSYDANGTHGDYLYVVETDGSRLHHISELPADDTFYDDHSPSISPDGFRVAFATFRHNPRWRWWFAGAERSLEIGSSALDGSGYRRLTDREEMDTNPAWSPDGERIAFISGREDTGDWGIYTMLADGSGIRRVTPSSLTTTKDPPLWSPDGRRIAFLVEEDGEATALYTVEAGGSGLSRISETSTLPAWSPDGTRIAFAFSMRIFTARPDSSDLRELTVSGLPTYDYGLVSGLYWSPDGSEIRFVGDLLTPTRPDQGLSKGNYPYAIYAIAVNGDWVRKVTDLWNNLLPAWSPDGSRIAIYSLSDFDNVVLYTIEADGSGPKLLVWREDWYPVTESTATREPTLDIPFAPFFGLPTPTPVAP